MRRTITSIIALLSWPACLLYSLIAWKFDGISLFLLVLPILLLLYDILRDMNDAADEDFDQSYDDYYGENQFWKDGNN